MGNCLQYSTLSHVVVCKAFLLVIDRHIYSTVKLKSGGLFLNARKRHRLHVAFLRVTRTRHRDWLKLAGEKISREQVGTVPTFLSVRANKFAKWKTGFTRSTLSGHNLRQ